MTAIDTKATQPLEDAQDVYYFFCAAHESEEIGIYTQRQIDAVEDLEDEVYASMANGEFWSRQQILDSIRFRIANVEE